MAGNYSADSAALAPSMFAGVTQPLAAAAKTPIGPVATSMANAVIRTARHFNSAGRITVVNFPGGGAYGSPLDAEIQCVPSSCRPLKRARGPTLSRERSRIARRVSVH